MAIVLLKGLSPFYLIPIVFNNDRPRQQASKQNCIVGQEVVPTRFHCNIACFLWTRTKPHISKIAINKKYFERNYADVTSVLTWSNRTHYFKMGMFLTFRGMICKQDCSPWVSYLFVRSQVTIFTHPPPEPLPDPKWCCWPALSGSQFWMLWLGSNVLVI